MEYDKFTISDTYHYYFYSISFHLLNELKNMTTSLTTLTCSPLNRNLLMNNPNCLTSSRAVNMTRNSKLCETGICSRILSFHILYYQPNKHFI